MRAPSLLHTAARDVAPLSDAASGKGAGIALIRALSRLPLAWRRRALRFIFTGGSCFGAFRPTMSEVSRMATALHLPARDAHRLVRSSYLNDLVFAMELQALAGRRTKGLLADALRITTDAPDEFETAADGRGLILATLHMGPYPLAITWLLHRFFGGRNVVLLRSKDIGSEEAAAFGRLHELGVSLKPLFIGDRTGFAEMLEAMRRGSILVMLADLPASYGRSSDAEILWREGRLAAGVSDLAALCRVPILLFRVQAEGRGDVIKDVETIHVDRADEASRRRTAGRIADYLTRAVIDDPAQWHLWDRLDEFYAEPGASAA